MTDEMGTPDECAEGRPACIPRQPGNAKARTDGQQGADQPRSITVSRVPEPPEIVAGRYVSREPDENESGPPKRPLRIVSRAPDPPPRLVPSCTSWEPKQKEPAADADLKDAEWRCEELIRSARTLRRFRGSLWDAEKKRWPFYRKQIDEGLVRCGLSDDPAFQRKIDKLDHEWEVACELRIAAAAALETSDSAAQAAFMQQAPGADPQNVPDVGGNYQADWDLWHGRNHASDELSAAIAADYAAVLKQHDEAGRRRVIHDRRVKRIECITPRLAAPASLKDRAHICVWDIIEDRTAANPEMRAAWLDALAVAVNAGLFNQGRRQQSQLFSFSDAGHVIRWDKKSLATFQQATDAAAHELKLDRDKYRLQRLESLARGAWMPRRFIARWLTEYCKLSRLPWWLEDETPDDLRGELERVHAAYVDVNGKDEWDGFREPCWTHVQTIIWRLTRDPAAVDKASTDSNRPSLGDTYAKSVGAAVIEMLEINIGEVKDAARELRRLCLAGEMTAYDRSGVPIDKMSWVSLEIVLDNENLLWITRSGQRVGDVVFRRDDVLGVWPETARTGSAQSLPSTQRDDEDTVPATVAPAGASTSEQFAASIPITRVPLRDYWISKGASFPPPNPPIKIEDYEQWKKSPECQAAAEADQRAWREICEEAAAGKISIEALQVANPGLEQPRDRYPDYRRYNQRLIVPPQFFEQDIMIGPANPVVIYYRGSSPFDAPWVFPVVILRPEPATDTSEKDVAELHSNDDASVAQPHATPPTDATKSLPVQRRRAGRRAVHDWDEATLFLKQEWEKRGDPDLPKNQVKDWRSDSDIWDAVIDHLQQTDKEQEPPDSSTVRKKLSPEVEKLRRANRQN